MKPILLIDARGETGGTARVVFDRYTSSMAVFEVLITNTAVVRFKARAYDGGAQVEIEALNLVTGDEQKDAAGDGLYRIDVSGIFEIVPYVQSWTSGTVTVKVVHRRG